MGAGSDYNDYDDWSNTTGSFSPVMMMNILSSNVEKIGGHRDPTLVPKEGGLPALMQPVRVVGCYQKDMVKEEHR